MSSNFFKLMIFRNTGIHIRLARIILLRLPRIPVLYPISKSIIHFADITPKFQNSIRMWSQQSLERLDDASTELMMSSGDDNVMLLIGESFFDTSEQEATDFCEAEVERMNEVLEKYDEEEASILEEQQELKRILYGRFGKSIQLEDKV